MQPEITPSSSADGSLLGAARRADSDSAPEAPERRKRRVGLWVSLVVLVVILAVAGTAAVFALQAMSARDALNEAKRELSVLSAQLTSGDQAAIQRTADAVTAHVTEAAEIVDGPLWNVAARVPFVGQNVDAVQRVTRAVDILIERALPAGLAFISTVDLDKLTVEGGGINLEPFRQVQGSMPEISGAFQAAHAEVESIDRAQLLPYVAEPIDELLTIVQDAAPALDIVNRYLPTLLDMAGSGGTKTYLVIFQNNAEIRATGGNPAASMILTMTDGKLGFAEQASSQTFIDVGTAGNVYLELPPETLRLYLPTINRYSQDYTMTPDFPTTAQLFQSLWAQTTGATFDGVISIDPVVLSHMLAVAGPVTLASGEQVTAENAVPLLLSESYERYPNGLQSDLFFADVAQRVFTHLTTSTWDPMDMLAALETSAREQRVNLSFVDPNAQALAVELGVDGALATDNAAQTQVGIYLNDSSVGKLEYHLTTAVAATCDAAARTMTTTMTMHNAIPDGIQSAYTLGYRNRTYGIPPTTMMLDVLFFAPPAAQITQTDPATGEVADWDRGGIEEGNTALSRTVFVPQNETVSASYTIALPTGDLGPLNLRHTPTASSTTVTVDPSCDGLFRAPSS